MPTATRSKNLTRSRKIGLIEVITRGTEAEAEVGTAGVHVEKENDIKSRKARSMKSGIALIIRTVMGAILLLLGLLHPLIRIDDAKACVYLIQSSKHEHAIFYFIGCKKKDKINYHPFFDKTTHFFKDARNKCKHLKGYTNILQAFRAEVTYTRH